MLAGKPCSSRVVSGSFCSGQSPFSAATSADHFVKQRQRRSCRRHTQARGLPLQHNVQEQSNRAAVASRGSDPFVAAGSRLQNLLSGIGDGEREILESFLTEQTPEFKLTVSLLAGGVITAGALALCWLTGCDPRGGASVSLHSLMAATLGAAACAPLVMLKAGMWSSQARRRFPVLEALQRWQTEAASPLVSHMSFAQTMALVAIEVLPTTLMTLPAAQGGLTASFQIYANHLQDWGFPVPSMGADVAALALTACLAAVASLGEVAPSIDEYEVVQTASENADRYYRVMAVGTTDRNPVAAADAFKAVADQWIHTRMVACNLVAVTTAAEVAFVSLLWRMTGDMAAPVTAALMLTGVDYAFMKKLVDARMKRPE